MAKLMANGVTIEGTPEELAAIMKWVSEVDGDVEPEEVAEAEPLKVGDYAKVIVTDTSFNSTYRIRDVVKISKIDATTVHYRAGDEGNNERWFPSEHITKVLPEEVASAKAQAEADAIERKRTEVFTTNGREVNEYRKGDIIRYEGDEDGKAYEVSHVKKGEVHFFDDSFENKTEFMELGAIVLITFVENRLDRIKGGRSHGAVKQTEVNAKYRCKGVR